MDVFIDLIVVIISQDTCVTDCYIVHLQFRTMLEVNCIPIKVEKNSTHLMALLSKLNMIVHFAKYKVYLIAQ